MSEALDLSELQRDVLCEIGSIGAGHAATALSQLIDRKVLITVPGVLTVPVLELPAAIVEAPETPVVAVYVRVLGDISGTTLFLLERESALRIVSLLRGDEERASTLLAEAERNLLRQAGGILVASYLNALARLVNITVLWSQPSFAFDMAGAILDAVTVEVGLDAELAIVIDARFMEAENEVGSRLIFLPSLTSLDLILRRLGVI